MRCGLESRPHNAAPVCYLGNSISDGDTVAITHVIDTRPRIFVGMPGRPLELDRMRIKAIIRVCSVISLVTLAIVALSPAKWQPRTGLGWQVEHVASHFIFTLMCCAAWPRPLIVGIALAAVAVLLEGLQALTPDRSAYLPAALYSAGGVLAAALLAALFIRAWRWHRGQRPVHLVQLGITQFQDFILGHHPRYDPDRASMLNCLLVTPHRIAVFQHPNRGPHVFVVHYILVHIRARLITQHLNHFTPMLLQLRVPIYVIMYRFARHP
jgi:hypothetical protein